MLARSLDGNPIENVGCIRKHLSQILEELEEMINLEWNLMPENLVIEIAKSFHSSIIKLINSNGNRIMY